VLVERVREQLLQSLAWTAGTPNNEVLWAGVREQATNFLVTLWHDGELLGAKAEDAFFVRCDRTTMTQSDIDNGRLIVVVGIAAVKPAEFVVIQIEQLMQPTPKPKPRVCRFLARLLGR
jgi:phage tail sheath protein FI